ncbi:hypothetical protein E2K20_25925 [Vibrio parahaemolyticus]|nr:hypothetical protein [Vibrio parahaemolyticus]
MVGSPRITKHSRGIHNAWQFWFESALVLTAQWFRSGGLRCSPLNAALALGLHQRLKVSVFIGCFYSLYTCSNVPFRFAPVALDVKFSL